MYQRALGRRDSGVDILPLEAFARRAARGDLFG